MVARRRCVLVRVHCHFLFSYFQHHPSLKEQSGYALKGTLKYFHGSRFKHIAPAYFSMLIQVSFAAAILFNPQDLAIYQQSLKKSPMA